MSNKPATDYISRDEVVRRKDVVDLLDELFNNANSFQPMRDGLPLGAAYSSNYIFQKLAALPTVTPAVPACPHLRQNYSASNTNMLRTCLDCGTLLFTFEDAAVPAGIEKAAEALHCRVDESNPIRHLLVRDLSRFEVEAVAKTIAKHVPVTPAEEWKIDVLLPVVAKTARESCRNYAKGCPPNQPDESYWCGPCSAIAALQQVEVNDGK